MQPPGSADCLLLSTVFIITPNSKFEESHFTEFYGSVIFKDVIKNAFEFLKIINCNAGIKKSNFKFATKIYMYFYMSNLETTHELVRILRDFLAISRLLHATGRRGSVVGIVTRLQAGRPRTKDP